MEYKDNCAICRVAMSRGDVKKMVPCNHLLHSKCVDHLAEAIEPRCPICRSNIEQMLVLERKKYKKNNEQDRERIVNCANRGEDWVALAANLAVNYKTAHSWLSSGRVNMEKRGGRKEKKLTEEEINIVISWIEERCDITLKQISQKVLRVFNKVVAVSTLGNYLEGRMYTLKQVHTEPVAMNSEENRRKRATYVQELNNYIRQGKQIVWIDQTNFNLFCRRTRGRALKGDRSVQVLPASRGPNVHLIGAISAAGVVLMERRRGSFTSALANAWMERLLIQWQETGNQLSDLVVVCDNAPCHSRLEQAVLGTGASILRLAPYSPMLNPIESVWGKIVSHVKTHLQVPEVVAPGVAEQRLVYLESVIDEGKNLVVGGDCARAVQHSTTFHGAALALEPMPVGQ